MAQPRDFSVLAPLYDVTVYYLAPGSTGVNLPVSGALGKSGNNTYAQITPNTIPNGTSQLPSGVAGDALLVEVISPVVSNGGAILYPDVQWWPVADSTDLSSPTPAAKFFADGSYGGNLFPMRSQVIGRKDAITIGISLRKLLNDAKNGHPSSDMALKATGWKFNSTLQVKVQSSRGFGAGVSGDTVVTPLRIIVWGERITDNLLEPLAQYYRGAFSRTTLRRYLERASIPMTISGFQNGQVSVADIATLPGGYNQKGDSVFRDVRFASNNNATGSSSRYFLTNSQQAYGTDGNVDSQYSGDLGMPFAPVNGVAANAKSALILQKFGVVAGVTNLAYVGLDIGDAVIPDPNGWPVGPNVDRLVYGQAQPLRGNSEIYYPLPDLEVEIDVFGENASAFIAADGTAVAAGAASVAMAGVAVQLSGGVTAQASS